MILFTGKLSNLIKFFFYLSLGTFLLVRNDSAHKVKIYHGQAYIDCEIDGDDNTNTCVSDFTVKDALYFSSDFMLGLAMSFAALFSLLDLLIKKSHKYSIFQYTDAVIVNPLFIFTVAVLCGNQELSTLILIGINTFMCESGIYIHDMGYWKSRSDKKYNHSKRINVLIVLNMITWSVIFIGLIDYWRFSSIPLYIPFMASLCLIHIFSLRLFHYKYFYRTIAGKLQPKVFAENKKLIATPEIYETKYEKILKLDPYVVDWGDSVKNILNLFFRTSIILIFIVGTNYVKITYI